MSVYTILLNKMADDLAKVAVQGLQKTFPPPEEIAGVIGDTFIQFEQMSPVKQWGRILDLLNTHGYSIVDWKDRP